MQSTSNNVQNLGWVGGPKKEGPPPGWEEKKRKRKTRTFVLQALQISIPHLQREERELLLSRPLVEIVQLPILLELKELDLSLEEGGEGRRAQQVPEEKDLLEKAEVLLLQDRQKIGLEIPLFPRRDGLLIQEWNPMQMMD